MDAVSCPPPSLKILDRKTLLGDFPVLTREVDGNRLVYLDSAATSLAPRQVVSEMARYYLEMGGTVHRGLHRLSDETSDAYETGRQEVARFLGCAADEVVFVHNATDAVNLVARSLQWHADDHVLLGVDAHHSNQLPWRQVARCSWVDLDRGGQWDLDRYDEQLKTRPRVVALTHASNATSIHLPVKQMACMAKQAGALVFVDASQSIPHRRLNVRDLNIDFLAFSGHKMLGPKGIGVLYARRDAQRHMKSCRVGGGAVTSVDEASFHVRPGPQGFEAGTPDVAGVLGLLAALQYLEAIGWDVLERHDRDLGKALYAAAREREHYLETLIPETTAERGATLSVRFKGYSDADQVARILSDSFGLMCRSGYLCAQPFVSHFAAAGVLRVSAYIYNCREDLDRLFHALDSVSDRLASTPAAIRPPQKPPVQRPRAGAVMPRSESHDERGEPNVHLGNGF